MIRGAILTCALLAACRPASRAEPEAIREHVQGVVTVDGGARAIGAGVVFVNGVYHGELALDGSFDLRRVRASDIVSLSLAEPGLEPGPRWARVGDGDVSIRVRPMREGATASRFVIAADTHAGIDGMSLSDQAVGLRLATAHTPAPSFIAVTGDLTQANKPEQFAALTAAIAELPVSYVPVPGNHDWYDGGATYRRTFGPPTYDFVAGDAHFIVLNDADSMAVRVAFLDRVVGRRELTIALMHAPPGDALIAALADRGVDALMTGHIHANRATRHGELLELNTEPLLMGGMDLTPAGYRVIDVRDGQLQVAHHATMTARERVAAAGSSWTAAVGGPVVSAAPVVADGRVFISRSDLATDRAGGVIALDASSGRRLWEVTTGASVRGSVAVADNIVVALDQSARVWAVDAPSGAVRWKVSLASDVEPRLRVAYATPLIAGGVVYTGVGRDFAAIDLRSGQVAWRRDVRSAAADSWGSHFSSHSSPILAGDRVLALFDRRGQLFAFDRRTGATAWKSEPGAAIGAQASPVVEGDHAILVDEQARLVRVDVTTGRVVSATEIAAGGFPWAYAASATPVVADGDLYIATRHGELIAPSWKARAAVGLVRATHYRGAHAAYQGSPVVTASSVIVGSADGWLRSHARDDGRERWSRDLGSPILAGVTLAGDWLYAVTFDGTLHAIKASVEERPSR